MLCGSMSDANIKTEATEPVVETKETLIKPASSQTMFGVPLDVFVQGGTTSAGHDNLMAQQRFDDEQRRNEADEERRIAARKNTGPGDIAKLHSMNLGTPQGNPVVVLTFVSNHGEVKLDKTKPMQMLADVLVGMNLDTPNDLSLILACPHCVSRGTPQGRAQFKVTQSNRPWHLDTRTQGELVTFEGQVYRSAGTIMDSAKIRCPQCNWSFRIDKNHIREDV